MWVVFVALRPGRVNRLFRSSERIIVYGNFSPGSFQRIGGILSHPDR